MLVDRELMDALAPKTDQLNADDLFGIESLVVTIRGPVTVKDGKLCIPLEEVKPYKPSKGMGRIIMSMFGGRESWPGKKLRLYRNPQVKFGGKEVGGIEISEASHIGREMTFAVTVSRGQKKPHKVRQLKEDVDPVHAVQVAFRQAVTEDEVKMAMENAASFTNDQKRRLADDYHTALKRIKDNASQE